MPDTTPNPETTPSQTRSPSPEAEKQDASATKPVSSPKHSGVDYKINDTWFALRLLIVLCLGALASFELAPYFLAQVPHFH